MDGMKNSLKNCNQIERLLAPELLASDPSSSYPELLAPDPSSSYAEPSKLNLIYKRVGYIRERIEVQNHLLTGPAPTCMEDLNEVSDIQREINDINTDLGVLRNNTLHLNADLDNNNINNNEHNSTTISPALANTG